MTDRLQHQQSNLRLPRWGLVLLSVLALLSPASSASARRGAPPLTRPPVQGPRAIDEVPVLTLPPVVGQQRLARDAAELTPGPLRFAVPNDVIVSPGDSGRVDPVVGGVVWRLRVESEGATDLSLGFGRFHLPEGATLHVWSSDVDYYEGPYTAADNESHGQLWVPPVPGSRAVIEVFLPTALATDVLHLELELVRVGSGYRNILQLAASSPRQGFCNNDVVCSEGDPWRDQIRSVAAYSRGGFAFCTGTLLADAELSFRNFFLTAAHCGMTPINAPSLVVYWNFESPTCGQLGGGTLSDNQTGAVYRSGRSDVDFTLLELDDEPAPESNVFYSGWDHSGAAPPGAVGIHHPRGDEKAISFDDDPLTTTNNCIGTGGFSTHWKVGAWDDGTTEAGSSGSGIWDPLTKRLVGTLSGGLASCSSPFSSDCYGKFALAWDGSSPNSRLRDWLDPNDSGVMAIDGADQGTSLRLLSVESSDTCLHGLGDGNSVAEPGEQLAMSFELVAIGAFSSIEGILEVGAPGAIVGQDTLSWPALGDTESALSVEPFLVSIQETQACYESLPFTLTVTAAEAGPFVFSGTIVIGAAPAVSSPVGIIDFNSAGSDSTITVLEGDVISDLDVRVAIDHPYVGDVSIKLMSPSGTEVILLDRPGFPEVEFGCEGADMDLVFDDAASLEPEGHCPEGVAPWATGTALPVQPLAAFNGESPIGEWTLNVADAATADIGTLNEWDLRATPAVPSVCRSCARTRFKFYRVRRARGEPRYAGPAHDLEDEFEARRVKLTRRNQLAFAVAIDGEPEAPGAAGLLCYKAVDDPDAALLPDRFPGLTVEVSSEIGSQRINVKKPVSLCRVARASTDAPPVFSAAPGLDSFTCYRARRASGELKIVAEDRSLLDPVESKFSRILRVSALCMPTSVDQDLVLDRQGALVCYDVKDARDQETLLRLSVFAATAAEDVSLALQRSDRLCVPASRVLVLP
jgi:hypothetical protein